MYARRSSSGRNFDGGQTRKWRDDGRQGRVGATRRLSCVVFYRSSSTRPVIIHKVSLSRPCRGTPILPWSISPSYALESARSGMCVGMRFADDGAGGEGAVLMCEVVDDECDSRDWCSSATLIRHERASLPYRDPVVHETLRMHLTRVSGILSPSVPSVTHILYVCNGRRCASPSLHQ